MSRYRLCEVEEAVLEMDMAEIPDDIVETEDKIQLVVSGWSVYVESLNLSLRAGVVCIWDEEEEMFLPDYAVTVVYEGNIETGDSRSGASVVNESGESMQASFSADSLYYEPAGFAVTLADGLNGRLPMEQIEQLWCDLIMPKI
jgi:hypothetical protein